ncbi:MAG: hypothetical protein M3H12_06275 [Chromatiales bacterium]|nr:bifunctional (p)ppGpp synthetase/guanosine-3',5'-bis(diphosphate) 3'-pyrophosphohydrolase [Gammaproteobacteria bacterium]
MEKAFVSGQQTRFSPPNRGLSLGWRLALSTVLIISLVMGGISIGQQLLELKEERQMHEELLKMSLAPLAVRMEAAMNLETMVREVEEFHTAYSKKGYPVHEVVLLDAAKEPVFFTGVSADGENSVGYLQATMPIFSPLLDGGKGVLLVLKDSEKYRNTVRRDWLLWAVHFTVTVGVVFLFLAAAIYFQVTKPVNRLVRCVKKMEMGYWRPIELTGGAWEIRWLAWRFGNMVQEVQSSMTHLFEAEQKARSLMPKCGDNPVMADQEQPLGSGITVSDQTNSPAYRELLAVCERLETTSPDDPQAVQLGRSVWRQEALEANRLGFHQLKAQLEDAALHLMEPDAYRSLDDGISELKASWQEWSEQRSDDLCRLLEAKGIPYAEVLHRVKHTAGVWAKMQDKGLCLDEIHDLFAFRIIVPTEADCYTALGVIHQAFKPEVSRFKDYIAKPKGNSYRSLHTCVAADIGPVFEVQIRSVAMDRQAERGDAAHWLYKKGGHETDRNPVVTRWWRKLWLRAGEPHGP